MKKSSICISVASESANEFVDLAARAAKLADFVELRFDRLNESELDPALSALTQLGDLADKTIIGTYRSSENGQGGYRSISLEDRHRFWKRDDVRSLIDWADVELDINPECLEGDGFAFEKVIRSFHNFSGPHSDFELASLRDKALSINRGGRTILKVAVTPRDITESIGLWNLALTNDPVIPVGMGEYGLWTRILGPAYGSPVTYAAPDGHEGTAPGQIGFRELDSVYRAEELDRTTEVFGIVGKSSVNSLSPFIHNPAFTELGLNSVYLPLPVKDAREFYKSMVAPETREIDLNFRGLSVTHPHKETLAELVDELDETAAVIGAINTVRIADGKVSGFNTDAEGFAGPLRERLGDLAGMKAGIIGTGGAAKAAGFALKEAGASVTYFSRNVSSVQHSGATEGARLAQISDDRLAYSGLDILVNATPQGSRGGLEDLCPVPAEAFENLQLAYDMVYNPMNTRFLREAEKAGIPTIGGLEMLIEQAVRQFEIWTGLHPSREIMRASAEERLARLS